MSWGVKKYMKYVWGISKNIECVEGGGVIDFKTHLKYAL